MVLGHTEVIASGKPFEPVDHGEIRSVLGAAVSSFRSSPAARTSRLSSSRIQEFRRTAGCGFTTNQGAKDRMLGEPRRVLKRTGAQASNKTQSHCPSSFAVYASVLDCSPPLRILPSELAGQPFAGRDWLFACGPNERFQSPLNPLIPSLPGAPNLSIKVGRPHCPKRSYQAQGCTIRRRSLK